MEEPRERELRRERRSGGGLEFGEFECELPEPEPSVDMDGWWVCSWGSGVTDIDIGGEPRYVPDDSEKVEERQREGRRVCWYDASARW
jgi:hypothetical protein